MAQYQKMTLEDFLEKLEEGRYSTSGAANRSVGKIKLSKAEEATARSRIGDYFQKTLPPKKAPKPAKKKVKKKTPMPGATLQAHKKGVPFEVRFARIVKNGQREDMLVFLSGAADRGYTLPDLIQAIESV